MRVNVHSLVDQVPGPDFVWSPKLSIVRLAVNQAALFQGFPKVLPVGEALGFATARARRS
ncbi:hypothetical protein AB0G76_02720 [Streptomyces asoensis]